MSKVYGYARISTKQQSIERQIRNILDRYPDAIIYQEAATGTKLAGREKLAALLKKVKPGDTIVCDAVDRLARNAADGVELYQKLYAQGVNLVFIKQPTIDTAHYRAAQQQIPMTGTTVDCILEGVNKFLAIMQAQQITAAFEQAEAEVTALHKRTSEGIETARRAGKQIGQQAGKKLTVKKAAPAKEIIRKHNRAFDGTLTDAETIKLAGIDRKTFYKYKKEMQADAEG